MKKTNMIMKVVEYIEDHLDDELSIDEVADRVGYSKFHLNRLFSESVGCTLYKYIQTRRLTKAAEKLVYTTKPIVEIAYDASYDSQQSFTHAFRQLYFCTPQKYRMIGIHTPKVDRFTQNSNRMANHKSVMKCEVGAA